MDGTRRRLPVGAELQPGGAHFRVWAPAARTVRVVFDGRLPTVELIREPGGYWSGAAAGAVAGTRYRYQLDDGDALPDPASRYQPDGPHGPSQVVDPDAFRWHDAGWRGVPATGQVLYELHVGTFTQEGTWDAARRALPDLLDLGITVVEMMPVADFAGRFGWGYDGVNLFAPTRNYGTPDDLRRFVDDAHRHGIGVILDVVYNHLGPDGNYLPRFSDQWLSARHATEWGEALNFDGDGSGPVREFFVANAAYWVREFHIDGLRLDATQHIFDDSEPHILREIVAAVRAAAGDRATLVIGENEPQQTRLVRPPEAGGFGLDALWNDDFHRAAIVAASGRREAYFSDFAGTPQELISAAKYGFLLQGQYFAWHQRRRGSPALDLPPQAFITFTQNHDQVANTPGAKRWHELTTPGRLRALTALLLLGPGTPMLFQGQEYNASTPFHYVADHAGDLARMVREGRTRFLQQFPSGATPEAAALLRDPADPEVFAAMKLRPQERATNRAVLDLHRDLLRLRREDAVFAHPRHGGVDGAVLADEAFLLRFFGVGGDDRLLLVNLGRDLDLTRAPEPLLAPPAERRWALCWSSEEPRYGGVGTPRFDADGPWHLPGHAALVLAPLPRDNPPALPR